MTNLQTFRARTSAEALGQVKAELGDDAVILHTRTITRGSVLGLGGRSLIEITAVKSALDLPPALSRSMLARDKVRSSGQAEGTARPMVGAADASRAPAGCQNIEEPHGQGSVARDSSRQVRRSRSSSLPDKLLDLHRSLVENQVAERIADDLVRRVRRELSDDELADAERVRRKLADCVESMLPEAGQIELHGAPGPTVIALVGATGVGKTTTVAKLAANFRLRQGHTVGLMTIDNVRVGAVEQLRAYAEIIDVPMRVVTALDEIRPAIDAMGECDLILVDTPGRNRNDEAGLEELAGYLAEARAHQVHLVLPANCDATVLERTIETFSSVGVNRVIFTKLDEAVGFGVILNCLEKAGARLSYLTTGQRVPDSIDAGGGRWITELILGSTDVGAAKESCKE